MLTLIPFDKDNNAIFLVNQKYNEASGMSVFENTRKKFHSQISYS